MTINRQWLLDNRPVGMIGPEHFKYVETTIPEPGEGEVLIRNLMFSFDPTQRGWTMDRESYLPPVQIGEPMRAGCAAQVVKSNHPDFVEGQLVQATNGWQDYAVVDPSHPPSSLRPVPGGAPPEMMLSVLGVTGLTAYFGLLDLGNPQPGETVLVSGAAGATGSVAGQIAKIKGCRVVGIAGGPEKCAWLTSEAGFDHAIDYKLGNLDQQIAEACPEKWNVFFDNVGGGTLEAALNHLNLRSRVVMCGGIANYKEQVWMKCTVRVDAFFVSFYHNKWLFIGTKLRNSLFAISAQPTNYDVVFQFLDTRFHTDEFKVRL